MLVSRRSNLPLSRIAPLANGESINGTNTGGSDSALVTNDADAPGLVLGDTNRLIVAAGRFALMGGNTGGLNLPTYTSGQIASITGKSEGLTIWNASTHLPNFWNGSAWIAGDGSGGAALPDPGSGTAYAVPYSNGAGSYLLSPAPGGNTNVALAVNDAGNALQWRRYMPATLVYGTNFLPKDTGLYIGANDGTATFSVYGQGAYVSQGSTILKLRSKLSPTADPTQLQVGSSDGYYGAMEVWAAGKGFYVYSGSNLSTPRSFWWMVDDVAMVSNVPIDSRAGDVVINGDTVTLALPVGKSAACYEVVITGNDGSDARYVLPAIISMVRRDDGTIEGTLTPLPSHPATAPAWVTEPVVDSGTNSAVITLAPSSATWRTSVRARALTNV